jgi:hypothetical protein
MSPEPYFELRCAVVEMFYGNLLDEKYTLGQTTARTLSEFQQEIGEGGRNALVILSVVLALLARHEADALSGFASEIESLRTISANAALQEGLSDDEKERLQEDIAFSLENV